jgi:uncharacterized membrane protein YdjX (TVP38/TMEM64 family)
MAMISAPDPNDSRRDALPSMLWGSAKALAGLLGLVLAILAMGLIIQRYLDVDALRSSIATWGMLAPPLFIGLLALRSMLFLPVLPLALVIGFASLMFGPLYGACYFWLGTTAGSCVAFLVAKHCVGNLADRLKRAGRLQKLDQLVGTNGFLAILGLRLVLFSNIWINYGSGLTSMTLKDFALGTLLGLTPRTFTLAYIFEGVQEPDMFAAMLSYPSLAVLSLLLGSKIIGVVLLASIARQGRWRAQTSMADATQ